MLRKLIALGIVAGLTKKAWDHYNTNGKPSAANGNAMARRKVKPAPSAATPGATATRPEHRA